MFFLWTFCSRFSPIADWRKNWPNVRIVGALRQSGPIAVWGKNWPGQAKGPSELFCIIAFCPVWLLLINPWFSACNKAISVRDYVFLLSDCPAV